MQADLMKHSILVKIQFYNKPINTVFRLHSNTFCSITKAETESNMKLNGSRYAACGADSGELSRTIRMAPGFGWSELQISDTRDRLAGT